jgi:putative spermidine/putrescine transport system ATP-binding protein
MEPALSSQGLWKSFGDERALAPVTFAIEEGEHLAITGPSGAGKTTLLRLLAGFIEPSGGQVVERGRPVNRPGWTEAPRRRGIGMVFQGLALWPHMTVEEQVRFSLAGEGRRLSRRERRRRAGRVLDEAGIARLGTRYPAALSGGERQRVAWARAVAAEPRLLLLDEPLTSLDPRLRAELLESVTRYGAVAGRTIVLVTHDLEAARKVGRRLLELAAGAG